MTKRTASLLESNDHLHRLLSHSLGRKPHHQLGLPVPSWVPNLDPAEKISTELACHGTQIPSFGTAVYIILVTTSKALVTTSDALVTNSFLLLLVRHYV